MLTNHRTFLHGKKRKVPNISVDVHICVNEEFPIDFFPNSGLIKIKKGIIHGHKCNLITHCEVNFTL